MLFNLSDAWAQSAESRTAEGQTEMKPLKIGDTIPEELWRLPLQVVNHPNGKDTITLNDYRGKKLIILDFWATWCGSCIAAFPRLYEIKDEFQDIALIANSAENADKVRGFVQAKQWPTADLMPFTVSNDLDLFFPHRFLPHYIWIKEGVYLGATDSKTVSLEKVSAVRSSTQPVLQNLKDDHVTFDRWKFYAKDPQLLSHVKYGSTILRHVPGINSSAGVHIDSVNGTKRYYYNNSALYQLYRAAAPIEKVENVFVPPAARIHLYNVEGNVNSEEGMDSLYCYEQVLPAGYSDEVRRSRMRSDLDRYFNFQSRVVRVETDILTIEGIPADSKEGISLDKVVRRFNRLLRQKVGDDIVQVSGNGGVLVPASFLQIDTADAVLKMLKRYGFKIKPEKRYIEVLIIDKTN